MGLNSALLAGVAGLKANSSALAALSDNIANVNTVGYKRTQANFQTIITANASQGTYNAGGLIADSRRFVSQQGLLQQTSNNTDLGISGSGFFVTTEKAEGVSDADTRSFTRAGSFVVDELGYLKNSAGLYLQGWEIETDGSVYADPSDLSRLNTINVTAIGGTAEESTRVTVDANLDAGTVPDTAGRLATYNATAAATSMSAYDAAAGTGIKPDFAFQLPILDSKGGKRTVAVSLLKSSVPNQWHAEIHAVPASDVEVAAGGIPGQLRRGIIAFTPDGRFDAANTTLFGTPAPTNPGLSFAASADPAPAAFPDAKWATALGVEGQDVGIDFGFAAGGLTQYTSESVVKAITSNGVEFGNLTTIEIDPKGFVTAIFDNGVTRQIAQVALATFANPDGLTAVSGNAFRVSLESGTYNLKAPGTGGAGFISPSTLEASTVDLSSEFTGMITTQRAYSASSKIITTADEMLEELLRIKR